MRRRLTPHPDRQPHADLCAGGRSESNLEFATQLFGPLAHRPETHPWRPDRRHPETVIGDGQFDLPIDGRERNVATACPGMLQRVGERFLGNAVQGHLDRGRQRREGV
jgi:hypothetical protein